MRALVLSLRRLYVAKKPAASLEKMKSLLAEGKITQEEFDYITN